LNLHNFEDEVHNIVDKAIKEMAMERMLKELEIVWSSMEFHHEVIKIQECFEKYNKISF